MSNRVVTFGCRLNTYESAVIEDLTTQAGLENAIIINTCSVTGEAERQARQTIRKIRRENPDAPIIVTGCAAQIRPDMFEQMDEVTHVIGNQEKMELATYTRLKSGQEAKVSVNDIQTIKETAAHLVSGFDGKVRAFVQIQNGCDHRCTFCTIPYGRGPSRSVPVGGVVEQIRHLITQGYIEIVFTGVDITAYGLDLPGKPTLGQMIERVFNLVPELTRLRLSSVDPIEVDEDTWRLIAEDQRILPHFHISLQAADDLILKRMKRRHLRHDIVHFAKRLYGYRPDAALGADIIAGFPTETQEHFDNTYRIIEECRIVFAHVFPFSPRPHTPASRMPQLPRSVIKERAELLRREGQRVYVDYMESFIGKNVNVLVEQENHGKTDHYLPISFTGNRDGLHLMRVEGVNHKELQGSFND
jgi:threonylcarbamoyladenosine tRNA methylthiotransferase MtaB